jgi:protein SCO1/2
MKPQTGNNSQENDELEQERSPGEQESVLPHHPQRSQHLRMNWRLASRLSVVTLVILVILIVTITPFASGSIATVIHSVFGNTSNTTPPASLQATDMGNQPAPNFRLTDQEGKQVSLTQFKGKPVVLTFLYTHCQDVCPLTAEHLHSTLLKMGSDAKKVGILAVSTDPKRDDHAAAVQFTNDHNMQNSWHFLIGTHEQLSPVWSAYSVYAQQQQTTVNHSFAVYVIDKQGNSRAFIGQDFKPDDLASYLAALVRE